MRAGVVRVKGVVTLKKDDGVELACSRSLLDLLFAFKKMIVTRARSDKDVEKRDRAQAKHTALVQGTAKKYSSKREPKLNLKQV
jgi:hypothetical protein